MDQAAILEAKAILNPLMQWITNFTVDDKTKTITLTVKNHDVQRVVADIICPWQLRYAKKYKIKTILE